LHIDGLHDFNNVKYLAALSAPIKVSWLGFAGPLGSASSLERNSKTIHYVMADKIVLPADLTHTRYYDEHIIYLPGTYQPQDDRYGDGFYPRDIFPLDATTIRETRTSILKESGYAEDWSSYLWLICFNRVSKITPETFEDWMTIMKHVPNSVLILMTNSANAGAIKSEAEYHGTQSDRILLFPKMNMTSYRRLLRVSDLFLDTRHYNAHTIASDAIGEGLPVLTLTGMIMIRSCALVRGKSL
jgi:protein O-GlcNAc transferase